MAKIQLDLPDKLNRYLGMQKEMWGMKDKREVIIKLIKERMSSDKEFLDFIKKSKKIKGGKDAK